MATKSVMIPFASVTTDAAFRAACQSFHDALVYCGLVWVTATPGQVDLSTVVKPSTAGTLAGYRLYRFDDALQATAPVYVQVGFNTSSTGATSMSFSVFAGDGYVDPITGAFSWITTAIQVISAIGYSIGTSNNSLFSGDGSRLQLALWGGSNARCLGSIERIKDANGMDTATGIVSNFNWINYKYSNALVFGILNNHQVPLCGAIFPTSITTGVVGSDTMVFPRRIGGPQLFPPILGLMSYFDANFVKGTPISVECYDGHTHTYLPLGNDDSLNQCHDNLVGPGTVYSLMRWE